MSRFNLDWPWMHILIHDQSRLATRGRFGLNLDWPLELDPDSIQNGHQRNIWIESRLTSELDPDSIQIGHHRHIWSQSRLTIRGRSRVKSRLTTAGISRVNLDSRLNQEWRLVVCPGSILIDHWGCIKPDWAQEADLDLDSIHIDLQGWIQSQSILTSEGKDPDSIQSGDLRRIQIQSRLTTGGVSAFNLDSSFSPDWPLEANPESIQTVHRGRIRIPFIF